MPGRPSILSVSDAEEELEEGSSASRDVEDEYVDELPEDLNAVDFVGPYLFPNNSRRRIPGILYLLIAAVCLAFWLIDRSNNGPLLNGGIVLASILLIVIGLYHLQSGWNLDVDEQDALVEAAKAVGFPVGHASAQMAWRGLRSRPTWRILLYSNDSPPSKRGFVMVDGVDAEVITTLVEDNPEDWAALESAEDEGQGDEDE